MKKNNKNGFTLIELIMVMIILGILSAVAIPRYLETIQKSEITAEDAVIDKLCAALENYAQHKMLTKGRRYWPENPFEALETLPQTYTTDGNDSDTDNEWTFVNWYSGDENSGGVSGRITHQRADNTRWQWSYNAGINHGTDKDVTGT
ncbi:MAG: prepilin-type N-terminal cleavage/methylation domain-containing protein, partial [Candidatus Marinimicrobia bacterium]|nr:prepilin-type N-terminal cleavage/methylation domain-containing protein [Candidatus Neomarinimicrobiota bacterium]